PTCHHSFPARRSSDLPPTTPAPVSADIYSESIEQQFAIVHDFLLTPLGAALLANDPWVRRGVATPSKLASHVATRVYRSKPFFRSEEHTSELQSRFDL